MVVNSRDWSWLETTIMQGTACILPERYCTVFVAVAGVTSFFSGLYVREPLMERSSLRSYCHDSNAATGLRCL